MTPPNLQKAKELLQALPGKAYKVSQGAHASGGHPSRAVELALKKAVEEIIALLDQP